MSNTVIKLEWNRLGPWNFYDQKREVMGTIDPRQLPDRARDAVRMAKCGYFHASLQNGRLVIGPRVIGDPGWQ
jgi:hypothetical protein